ncbi:conserved hypothetical protein, partial [Ricinus communis]
LGRLRQHRLDPRQPRRHHLAVARHELRPGTLRRAGAERRLRIVFERQLDHACRFLARQFGRQREAEVDTGRDAAARDPQPGRAQHERA